MIQAAFGDVAFPALDFYIQNPLLYTRLGHVNDNLIQYFNTAGHLMDLDTYINTLWQHGGLSYTGFLVYSFVPGFYKVYFKRIGLW